MHVRWAGSWVVLSRVPLEGGGCTRCCAAKVCGSRYAVLRPRTAKLPRPVATPPEPSGHTTKAWLAGHRKY